MRWSKGFVVFAGAVVLGCQAPELTRQQRAVEEQFVRDRFTAWTEAWNNREIDSLKAAYGEDGVTAVWPGGIVVDGAQQQRDAIDSFYNNVQYMNFVPQSPAVEVLSATVAIVRFRHSMDLRYADTRRELSSGQGTLVYVKGEDGVWKIHRQHLSVSSTG